MGKFNLSSQVTKVSVVQKLSSEGKFGKLSKEQIAVGVINKNGTMTVMHAYHKNIGLGYELKNVDAGETAYVKVNLGVVRKPFDKLPDFQKAMYPDFAKKLEKVYTLDKVFDKEGNLKPEYAKGRIVCGHFANGILIKEVEPKIINTKKGKGFAKVDGKTPEIAFVYESPIYNQVYTAEGIKIKKAEDYIKTASDITYVAIKSLGIVNGKETMNGDVHSYVVADILDKKNRLLSRGEKGNFCVSPTSKSRGVTFKINSYLNNLKETGLISDSNLTKNKLKHKSKFKLATMPVEKIIAFIEGNYVELEDPDLFFIQILSFKEFAKRNAVGGTLVEADIEEDKLDKELDEDEDQEDEDGDDNESDKEDAKESTVAEDEDEDLI